MTVAELIEQLEEFDRNKTVMFKYVVGSEFGTYDDWDDINEVYVDHDGDVILSES